MISRFAAEIATAAVTAALGLTSWSAPLEFGIGWGDAGPGARSISFLYRPACHRRRASATLVAGRVQAGTVCKQSSSTASRPSGSARFFVSDSALRRPAALLLGLYVATALYLTSSCGCRAATG